MTETGPCLVEVNLRCHGAGGVWMPVARAFAGYTQAGSTGQGQGPWWGWVKIIGFLGISKTGLGQAALKPW